MNNPNPKPVAPKLEPFSDQEVAIHVDAATGNVTFMQRRNQFAVKSDQVTVPMMALNALFAQLLMAQVQAASGGQLQVQVKDGSHLKKVD